MSKRDNIVIDESLRNVPFRQQGRAPLPSHNEAVLRTRLYNRRQADSWRQSVSWRGIAQHELGLPHGLKHASPHRPERDPTRLDAFVPEQPKCVEPLKYTPRRITESSSSHSLKLII